MNKQQEYVKTLLQLIQDNPELPIVPMVDYEVCAGEDHSYWMGSWGNARLDEYYMGEERVYSKDDFEDLVDEEMDRQEQNWIGKSEEEMQELAEEIVNVYQ